MKGVQFRKYQNDHLLCSEISSEGYQMLIDIIPNNVYTVGNDRCKGVGSYEILQANGCSMGSIGA